MKAFNVHVFGTMNVTYAMLPHMRKRQSGTVVIIGSKCAFNNEYDVSLLPLVSTLKAC